MNIAGKNPVLDRSEAIPAPVYVDEEADAGFVIDFPRLFATIKRNLPLIIGIVVVALVIGIIATMLTTPKYTATGSIQINEEGARVLNSETDLEPAPNVFDADRFLQTQVDVLLSRGMELRVARELKLFENQDFVTRMGSSVKLSELSRVEGREKVVEILRENLSVHLPRQSRVVLISFTSPDPELASKVVNAVSRAFIQNNLERKYDSSAYARDFLARQLAEAKERAENAERALNTYAREAGLIRTPTGAASNSENGTAPSTSVTTASLVQLNEVANQARATRIAAEQRWNATRSAPLLSIPAVLANEAVQTLLQERARRTADLRQERARHLESHPTVQQLTAQVNELDRQITDIARGIRDGIRSDYTVALEQERSLNSQVESLKTATLSEQDRTVQYNILLRDVENSRTMYDGLLQRFKEISASAGVTANNIQIVDQASVPVEPSSPKLWLNALLALFGGAALAVVVVFVRERLDDAIRVPEDAERKLDLPVVGVIPTVREGGNIIEELLSPRTNVAEAYHALRTSLIYSTSEGLPRSLLITSSQSGEGKSTTSFAIAHDLARLGKRVVLVDTDLRRPSLHNVLRTDNSIGVVDLITHHETTDAPIRASGYDNLAFISSGPIPPNPTELLSSSRMKEMVNQLMQEFDVVVLDGPPVLGLADAPILSAIADSTIFVIDLQRSRRGGVKAALRRLRTAHSHLIGCVLTKFDPKKAGSQHYSYEYYYYGNDQGSGKKIARA